MKRLTFFDRIIFRLNVFVSILFLLSFFGPYISINTFPIFPILNMATPIFFVISSIFLFYWLIRRKKKWLLSGGILVLGFLVLESFYKINFSDKKVTEKDLSIMTFNVRGFNLHRWMEKKTVGNAIIKFILDESPDILCIQEHNRIWNRELRNEYPFITEIPYNGDRSEQAIFSKFPIISYGSLNFPESANNCIYADILIKNDTIRVYNMHLQSYRVHPKIGRVTKEVSYNLYGKLTSAFKKQEEQAYLFLKHTALFGSPKIICGDFNNTQFSRTYNIVKGNMKDTFQEKGSGFGKTYRALKYPFRIDYILADQDFEVLSHKNYNERLSDHYPVMSTLRLKTQ